MLRNIGTQDRVMRIVIGLVLALLIYLGTLTDTAGLITGIVAAYLLLTGLAARCLFYKMLGIDTNIQEQPYSTTDDRAGL